MKHLKRLLEQVQQLKSPFFVENSQKGQTSLDIVILGISQEQNNSFQRQRKIPIFGNNLRIWQHCPF